MRRGNKGFSLAKERLRKCVDISFHDYPRVCCICRNKWMTPFLYSVTLPPKLQRLPQCSGLKCKMHPWNKLTKHELIISIRSEYNPLQLFGYLIFNSSVSALPPLPSPVYHLHGPGWASAVTLWRCNNTNMRTWAEQSTCSPSRGTFAATFTLVAHFPWLRWFL